MPDYPHAWDESAPNYSPRRPSPTDDEYLWRSYRNLIELMNWQGSDELRNELIESLQQAVDNGIISLEEGFTLVDYVDDAQTPTGYEDFARRMYLVRTSLFGPNNVERVRNLLQNIRASPDQV